MEIKRFDDFIICPIPAESELDQVEIEKLWLIREIHGNMIGKMGK